MKIKENTRYKDKDKEKERQCNITTNMKDMNEENMELES